MKLLPNLIFALLLSIGALTTLPLINHASVVYAADQCQATTKAWSQCKRAAQPGQKLCWQHSAAQSPTGRCQATTKKGTQCSRPAKAGSKFCWQHSK